MKITKTQLRQLIREQLATESSSSANKAKMNAMAEEDQRERIEYADFVRDTTDGDYELGAKLWAKSKNRSPDDVFLDKDRQEIFIRLKFDFEDFNDDDWGNYWVLSQHCDGYRDFQRQALENIKTYLGADSKYYHDLSYRIAQD